MAVLDLTENGRDGEHAEALLQNINIEIEHNDCGRKMSRLDA